MRVTLFLIVMVASGCARSALNSDCPNGYTRPRHAAHLAARGERR